MVVTQDLFKKLARGAKFTNKRKLSMLTLNEEENHKLRDNKRKLISNALDFFGDSKESDASEIDDVEQQDGGSIVSSPEKKRKLDNSKDDRQSMNDQLSVEKKSKTKLARTNTELIQQTMNAFRKEHRIYVNGTDIPHPVKSFEELASVYKVPSYIVKNLSSAGFYSPTPIQMQAIPVMLHRREIVACAPTGSGKTAAFLVPILTHLKSPERVGFRAVIVSPTRELAQQTYRECVRLSTGSGLRVHVLTKATASANSFGQESSQRFDILITTPNRLIHLLSFDPPGVNLDNVEWLVFDECDKLFEEGVKGFKDQFDQIYLACTSSNVKRGFFSATLASQVEDFCQLHCDSYIRVTIGVQNSAAEFVDQEVLFVGQESGKLLAMRNMIQQGFTPPMLVFVQSIDRAKELFHELIYDGMNVDVIHSERTQAQRDNVIKSFRDGKIWILICTDLMGRGIDFKGVNIVINYDFPPTAISYIHRIGRTGRAGRKGQAITYFTEEDIPNVRSIANVMRSSGCSFPDWMLQIKKPSKSKSKKPLKRDAIKTVSKYDLQKAKKKREMIASSKRKHKSVDS